MSIFDYNIIFILSLLGSGITPNMFCRMCCILLLWGK